ncbi:helix-turn-helix transcriptional regulator [Caldalkalibacillus mannanilyticus]|uniref:helix-turn-helix transcriptional regulator n=1 Tax=Caldalkalibacillus mannanilyticus TaxID=1418 RepID=UPI00046ABF90|nr:YafY family protein [Caldalkalibacillus mannanilyticus]
MSRSSRLFELLIILNTKHKFSVEELATRFGVSRRTMLRDLHSLSEMGVPLHSSTGPNGGYSLIREQTLPSISLTPEEATGLILSYECLEQYQDGPFIQENLSTLTKIRALFSVDMLKKVEILKEKLGMNTPRRSYKTPYLSAILKASLERVHLEIEYESLSGTSIRRIYPHGLYMSNGLWYCLAYCYKRNQLVSLRVDRILHLSELPDCKEPPPEEVTVRQWLNNQDSYGKMVSLKASLTRTGCKLLDPHDIGEWIQLHSDGTGVIDKEIKESDIPFYGRLFLSLANEIHVKEPPELSMYLQEGARNILKQYQNECRQNQ